MLVLTFSLAFCLASTQPAPISINYEIQQIRVERGEDEFLLIHLYETEERGLYPLFFEAHNQYGAWFQRSMYWDSWEEFHQTRLPQFLEDTVLLEILRDPIQLIN